MSQFALDQAEGGTVELRSGTWRWHRLDVLNLPERTIDRRLLVLTREDEPGSRIRMYVDPEAALTDDTVA